METRSNRRTFLKNTVIGGAGLIFLKDARSARSYAANEELSFALVGCGGRGTQAVIDLLTGTENVELVAMADVFEDKLEASLARLRTPGMLGRHAGIAVERNGVERQMSREDLANELKDRIKVEPDHHFTGFDAFRKLIASDVDIVMLCTPPGYRPMHFEAAVEAGKHVFTEKPIATDATGVRRFLAAGEKAAQKKLTVVSGAQRHAHRKYYETVQKIKQGSIGDILAHNLWIQYAFFSVLFFNRLEVICYFP
jgi:predicted dehydrogenase